MMGCKPSEMLAALLSRPAVELRLVGFDKEGEKLNESEVVEPAEMDEDALREEVIASRRKISNFETAKARHATKLQEQTDKVKELTEEVDELKKNGISDAEVAQKLTAAEKQVSKLEGTVSDLRIENSFLQNEEVKWVSKSAALKLLEKGKLEIDADGTVHGLDEAVEALSKESPFLVVAGDKQQDDQQQQQRQQQQEQRPPRRTGDAPAGNRTSTEEKNEEARKSAIRSKYSALRR